MKKGFIAILLICSFFAFAETGYNHIEWYTPQEQVVNSLSLELPLKKWEEYTKLLPMSEMEAKFGYTTTKNILGENVTVSYHFGITNNISKLKDISDANSNCLLGVSYIMSNEKAMTLLDTYKNLVSRVFVKYAEETLTKNCGIDQLVLSANNTKAYNFYLDISESLKKMYLFLFSEYYEDGTENVVDFFQYSEKRVSTSGIFSIYGYNDDTKVYVYEDFIKGKTIFVYVPLKQEYSDLKKTGYDNTPWYTEENKVDGAKILSPVAIQKVSGLDDLFSDIKIMNSITTNILNQIPIYYIFTNDDYFLPETKRGDKYRLCGVSCIFSRKDFNKLNIGFAQFVNKYTQCNSNYWETVKNKFNKIDYKELNDLSVDMLIQRILLVHSIAVERCDEKYKKYNLELAELKPEKSTLEQFGTIYVYNYNKDTRMYIYDNIIKNKIIVIYVPRKN